MAVFVITPKLKLLQYPRDSSTWLSLRPGVFHTTVNRPAGTYIYHGQGCSISPGYLFLFCWALSPNPYRTFGEGRTADLWTPICKISVFEFLEK